MKQRYLVFVKSNEAYSTDSTNHAENLFSGNKNSVLVERKADGKCLVQSLTFTEPLVINNYVEVRDLVTRLF